MQVCKTFSEAPAVSPLHATVKAFWGEVKYVCLTLRSNTSKGNAV